MRLHEAAPKLIIQERLGDKVKVSSYWPVPELTRAELALGRLHFAILAVSFSDSDSSAIRSTHCIGSSYGSANHVSRINASALRSCSVFRNFHEPMGKTPYQVPRVETLGRHWLKVG